MSEWTKAVEVVAQVIDDEGGRPGSSLHSWRCEYPDRYGECSCVAETAEEIVKALRTAGLLADPTARTEVEWGVACPLDDDVIPTADPDWSVRHHDRNCGPGHRLVRRTVTDWTPAEEPSDD